METKSGVRMKREEVHASWVDLEAADGSRFSGFLARPSAPGSYPGILVFMEAFGVNRHIRNVTERIAGEGYLALAPDLYHRSAPRWEGSYEDFSQALAHLRQVTVEQLSADVQGGYRWLSARGAGRSVGAVGFCFGGRVAFLSSTVAPLRAACSFYGGGIAPELLDRAKDVSAPLLLFWGGRDQHIPPEQIRATADALRAAGKSFIEVTFSEAGHGFFCEERGSYNPEAARMSWPLLLEFFGHHLR
ncbi:MAG: dienelactone hydrolase family protein [Methylacidiphilaceae bacterium]|nr:dienelactone hydrolase family protein [Candidatus Methylacidiphilaceae bacterium]